MISKRLGERTGLSRTRGPFCSSFVGFSSKISGFSRISNKLGTKEEFELVFAVVAVDTVEAEGSSLSFDGFKSDLSVLKDVFDVGCVSPAVFVEVDLVVDAVEVVEVDDDVEVGNVVVEVGAVAMTFEVKVISEDGPINDAVVEVGMVVVVVAVVVVVVVDLIINFVVDVVEVEVVVVSSVVV